MKVIFTPDIFSVQRHGGISRYFAEVIRRLPAAGVRPVVAAGLHRNAYLRELPGILGIYAARVGRRRWLNERWCRAVGRFHPGAVVHETFYHPHAYTGKNRTVLTVYDMIDEIWGDRSSNPEWHRNVSAIKRVACERADHLIAISEATKQDLVRLFGTDPAKVTVIHLATALSADGHAAPPPAAGNGSRPYLLHVGPRSGYKNFDVLLGAYAGSAALRENFDLVCFGGPDFDAGEQGRLRSLGVEKNVVRRTGGDETLLEAYRAAAVYVCPSLYEGFGLPVLEAMSLGCPVICARTGALEEVAADAARYFDPGSSADLGGVLEETLGQPEELSALRERGRRRARAFSWDKCVAETLAVYRTLA